MIQPITTPANLLITPEDIAECFGGKLIDQDNFSKTADYEAIYDEGIAMIRKFEQQVKNAKAN